MDKQQLASSISPPAVLFCAVHRVLQHVYGARGRGGFFSPKFHWTGEWLTTP